MKHKKDNSIFTQQNRIMATYLKIMLINRTITLLFEGCTVQPSSKIIWQAGIVSMWSTHRDIFLGNIFLNTLDQNVLNHLLNKQDGVKHLLLIAKNPIEKNQIKKDDCNKTNLDTQKQSKKITLQIQQTKTKHITRQLKKFKRYKPNQTKHSTLPNYLPNFWACYILILEQLYVPVYNNLQVLYKNYICLRNQYFSQPIFPNLQL
eukprot:TRINITY_DN3796_c0_g1_i8.p1 TRINITY_DN3796_c0_g1~~TRINITY_DN3796_c0_g1_i8.p1  ORF type:complete len:205 (-),score=-11.00 TRINITY_DN3796_c0_g1_i8:43-657(-)